METASTECGRCRGLMIRDVLEDERASGGGWVSVRHCLNCGHVEFSGEERSRRQEAGVGAT